jgi:hypothetical protein
MNILAFIIALWTTVFTFNEDVSLSPHFGLADCAESSTSEGGELKRRTPSSFNNDNNDDEETIQALQEQYSVSGGGLLQLRNPSSSISEFELTNDESNASEEGRL